MDVDVVVIGEVLVELSSTAPFEAGVPLTLGFSGDALNAAAASAAAGAHTALLTLVADDELGHALLARVRDLGVSTELVRLVPGQHGAYFVHSDPHGERQFAYARGGSAASRLDPADVAAAELDRVKVVVSSGVTGAASTWTRTPCSRHIPRITGRSSTAPSEVVPNVATTVPIRPDFTAPLRCGIDIRPFASIGIATCSTPMTPHIR